MLVGCNVSIIMQYKCIAVATAAPTSQCSEFIRNTTNVPTHKDTRNSHLST